jgi:hypothetical protein
MAGREETADPAAEAFEDHRDDVAELRSAVEQLPKRIRNARAPDYAATLGAMMQTLERIESHPALQITPQRYATQLVEAVQATGTLVERDVQGALRSIREASDFIHRFAGGCGRAKLNARR